MKKFLFIDNDQERDVQEYEKCHVHNMLECFEIDPNDIEFMYAFWHKCREEKDMEAIEKMLLHENRIIVTYSMYTTTHFGSLQSFLHFLNLAGRSRAKNLVYINTSSEDLMIKALEFGWDNSKSIKNIIQAVSRNHLLSYNFERNTITRVVVDLKQDYRVFVTEDITWPEYRKLISNGTEIR